MDAKARAAPRFAVHLDPPAVRFNNAIGKRPAQPGALPDRPGGKERADKLGELRFRNATTGIRHIHSYAICVSARMHGHGAVLRTGGDGPEAEGESDTERNASTGPGLYIISDLVT